MTRTFFVKRGERIHGPTGLVDMQQHASTGRLRQTDLVSESKDGPWQPAIQVNALAKALVATRASLDGPDAVAPFSSSGSRKTVLLWSLVIGGVLVLLTGGGVAVMWLSGSDPDEPPPQPAAISDNPEIFQLALRLEAAARVIDRANSWVADAGARNDRGLDERRDELATTAKTFGDRDAVGVECLRLNTLLDRYVEVRVELETAKQVFVDLNPRQPRYREPTLAANAARRIGVARLTELADDFIEVLRVAQDDQAAMGRLVSMSQAEFDRATLVMPLKSTTTQSRMVRLAQHHSHLRVAAQAGATREQLADERAVRTVLKNRKATASAPLVLKTPAKVKETVAGIEAHNGSRVVLVWTPAIDSYWRALPSVPEGLPSSLQTVGLAIWPSGQKSLRIQVEASMLQQLVEWTVQQRQFARKESEGNQMAERPLFLVSKQSKNRYLSTGNWERKPEIIVGGELGVVAENNDLQAVLQVDSIVVGVAPTVATLIHNRKSWGLVGRAIRRKSSFPITLHRPRTLRMVGGKSATTFDPYGAVGAEHAGGGEDGYLRGLVGGEEKTIKTLNDAITARMQVQVKKTQAILPAVTIPRLEQGLVGLVGSKQAKVDARTIEGAGLRAVLAAHRFSGASEHLYSDGALFAYNITMVRSVLSSKGGGLFDSEIRDRILEFVIAEDGIWLLSNRELCAAVLKVLPRAGFYTKSGRKPVPPTDSDPDVAVFEPSLPREPVDPRAPLKPVVIIEPADSDGQAACRRYAAGQAVAHERELKKHQQNIVNGAYNTENDWQKYRQALAMWERTREEAEKRLMLRKTRLGESVKLREDLQATWNQIALTAYESVKKRAGRPETGAVDDSAPGKNTTLLPSIRETLTGQMPGGVR